jgi:hypothetical protein
VRALVNGAVAMGCFVVGLFFWRFYRERRDALFALFGSAFWLMAGNHTILGLSQGTAETQLYVYVMRLLAFLLIIAAIVQKNRARD